MLHSLFIAALVLLSIAALVFVLISITRKQQRQRKELLRNMMGNLIVTHQLRPEQTEEFEHRILALDTTNRKLLFVQHDETTPSLVLNLEEYAECRIWKECKGVSFTGSRAVTGSAEHVSAIGLVFVRRNEDLVKVPLYTEILDGIGERQRLQDSAEAWRLRILALETSMPAAQIAL